jgi:hypothetical protein
MSIFNSSLSLKKHKKSSKKKPKKISIEPFSSSICVGIQSVLSEYDKYGYCSLFSMFWLYCVLNCFFDINEKNKNIPPLKEWIKNVENILLEIFKNDQEKLYNLVITFAYRLFSRYYSSNLLTVNDRNMILEIQEDSVNILFSVYLDDMKSGKIKVYIEEKMEKIDESECDKKTIEKDIIIDDFQEDEGIEIDNTNFDDDEEDRNENVNNLSEEEKRRLLKEYYGEDFDLNIEEIENNENDIVPREYNYEDANEVPREYNYEDVNEVPREYNYEDANEVPREYNYEDVNEDMTIEFVDEPNQNEY